MTHDELRKTMYLSGVSARKTLTISGDLADRVHRHSMSETRTFPNMTVVLLLEAFAARKVKATVETLADCLTDLAESDHRTFANMAEVLLMEALDRREE